MPNVGDFVYAAKKDGTSLIKKYTGSQANVTIPNEYVGKTVRRKVTEIGEDAFDVNVSLKSVTIPEGVTDMGEYVFCSWTASQTIYLENKSKFPENWSKLWKRRCKAKLRQSS